MNPVVAEISKSSLRHNVQRVRELAPQSKVLAMVKANAYGHDAIGVAQALDCVDAFGVARINEALSLANAGIKAPIVLMEGCFNQHELEQAIDKQFELVVQNRQQLAQLLAMTAINKPVKVWLKLETGMHRVGVPEEQARTMVEQLQACSHVDNELTLVSHFACADEPAHPCNELQLSVFNRVTQGLDVKRSCANSAATIVLPQSHFDWVRPGLMLYGNSPLAGKTSAECGLKPVMTMKSQVIAVNDIEAGGTVGYGATWTAATNSKIAVVAMGYGDGYPRHAKTGTPVLINGKRYPMVGRVSMDMLTVNVGIEADVKIGDPVVLWGPELPAEEVAECAGTISYEIFCNLANRVKRVFVE